MFIKKVFSYQKCACISQKLKSYYNVKPSGFLLCIMTDFQVCISISLKSRIIYKITKNYRKICTMFLNFNNKIIHRISFGKTRKKVCQSARLYHTFKWQIKLLEQVLKNKMVRQKHFVMVRLRIRLLIFMRLTAERHNLMRLYSWSLPNTCPLASCNITLGAPFFIR